MKLSQDDDYDFNENPLRQFSTSEIEKAISKGLSELSEKTIKTKIHAIDWKPETASLNYRDASISMHVTERTGATFADVSGASKEETDNQF